MRLVRYKFPDIPQEQISWRQMIPGIVSVVVIITLMVLTLIWLSPSRVKAEIQSEKPDSPVRITHVIELELRPGPRGFETSSNSLTGPDITTTGTGTQLALHVTGDDSYAIYFGELRNPATKHSMYFRVKDNRPGEVVYVDDISKVMGDEPLRLIVHLGKATR